MTKTLHLWFFRNLQNLLRPHSDRRERDHQCGRIQLQHWNNRCQGTRTSEQRGKKSEGEAHRKIINKLSDERNLKDLHLKHCHMPTAQFKKRTTHLDILGRIYDLHQHVVKTCPFCISIIQRSERSRVIGLRAEEFGDLICLDHGSAKIGDEIFGFLILLDGATSHLTAYPCKSTSTSEAYAKLHEWMDTFQMNPKAICDDVAFHHPHDMQAFYRMYNVKRLPTGPHTRWPSRAEMSVRLFKKFLLALVDTVSKNLDQTTLAHITLAQLMRKSATVRNTQITSSGKTLVELAMGRRPRDLLDPASMNPEQLTSTPTKQDLLNEEIQKLAVRTHLEVQQREDIRRDLAERMFLPIFEQEKMCFIGKMIRTKSSQIAWQTASRRLQPKADNLITAVQTGKLLDVDIHLDIRTLMEHKTFLSTWCNTILHTREREVFFLNTLKISLG